MSATPNLQLPEFGSVGVPSGADLTRAMRRLDAVVQLAAIDFATAPPAVPILGDRYIVEAPATGEFLGRELQVAYYTQAGWAFFTPTKGWQAVVGATAFWIFDESVPAWVSIDIDFYSPANTKGDILVRDSSGLQRLAVGANGEVLTADSAQTKGVKWASVVPLTTKGDILTRSSSALVRVPVGTDGQVLVADSSQTSGLRYASISGGGVGSINVDPDTHPLVATAWDDEFEAAALDAKWTWLNQNASTATLTRGALNLKLDASSATTKISAILQSLTGAGSTWEFAMKFSRGNGTTSGDGAITLYNSGNGKLLRFGLVPVPGEDIFVQRNANTTTFTSNPLLTGSGVPNYGFQTPWIYLKWRYDGTSVFADASGNGVFYQNVYNETVAAFLGGLTDIGISGNSASTTISVRAFVDWFRKMA